jgi:hypothetical protein
MDKLFTFGELLDRLEINEIAVSSNGFDEGLIVGIDEMDNGEYMYCVFPSEGKKRFQLYLSRKPESERRFIIKEKSKEMNLFLANLEMIL